MPLVAIAAALGGGVGGWMVVPWAANTFLCRARARADAWWDDSLRGYRMFKREHPHAEPRSSAPGFEGAVGIWRDEAFATACAGALTEERLRALAEAGFSVEGVFARCTEAERCDQFTFRPRVFVRVVIALLMAAGCAAAAFFVPNLGAALLLGVCFGAVMVTVACDMKARTIPWETCCLIGLSGALFQVLIQGIHGLVAGLVFAVVIVAGCLFVNRMLLVRCPEGAVGLGDVRCMAALALATGAGTVCGFAACYVLAAGVALLGCATKKLSLGDGMPMAPFFVAWLACGIAACLVLL